MPSKVDLLIAGGRLVTEHEVIAADLAILNGRVAGVLGAVVSFSNITMDPRTFVETMYANGAKGYFDALSFHPYSYEQPFSAGLPATGCQFLCDNTPISMLLGLRQIMLDNLDGGVKPKS